MHRILQILFLLGLAAVGYTLDENDSCTDPAGKPGRCISFRECQSVMAIYTKAIISPVESKFIEDSRCGMSAKKGVLVCCAQKSTLPKPPNCGVNIRDRIFGGQKTGLQESPWVGLIGYRYPNGTTDFHCGASLINSRYVLTAAHCVKVGKGIEPVSVRLGEWDVSKDIDCSEDDPEDCADAPTDMDIEKIIVHEGYDPNNVSSHNDIALIRFTRDVKNTPSIAPVCLPTDSELRSKSIVGSKMEAAGWGRTESGNKSDIKLMVELEVKDSTRCANVYRATGVVLRDTQICAGGVRNQDTCSGDSGGPLAKQDRAFYHQYGIVSFGSYKCGMKGVPGIYTAVAKYIDWIEKNLE